MNVREWLDKARAFLAAREVPEADASVEFLMAEVLEVGRSSALADPNRSLSVREGHQFWNWVKERARRRPLAYVIGHQPFLGLRIAVTPDVLVPRPETEELALEGERLVKTLGCAAPKILEIGTGSGCIAIALAQLLPEATVIASDVSVKALKLAEKNALAHHVAGRVRFIHEDLFAARHDARPWADLLISNPPYIPTNELPALAPEVLGEPRLALDGGRDGLEAARALIAQAPRRLRPGGCLALEIGSTQGRAVTNLLRAAGFHDIRIRKDAQGLDRVAAAKK